MGAAASTTSPMMAMNIASEPSSEPCDATLMQVIVITRHGARLPRGRMPGDLCFPQEQMFYDRYGGCLTPLGQQQLWQMGVLFRRRYIETLGKHPAFNNDEVGAADASVPAAAAAAAADAVAGSGGEADAEEEEDGKEGEERQTTHLPTTKALFLDSMTDGKASVQGFCSNQQRTLYSAWSFLSGFQPQVPSYFAFVSEFPELTYGSSSQTNAKGIPIYVQEEVEDVLFHQWKRDPEYKRWKERVTESDAQLNEWCGDPKYIDLVDKLYDMTQCPKICPSKSHIRRMASLTSIQCQINIERAHGLVPLTNMEGTTLTEAEFAMIDTVSSHCWGLWYKDAEDDRVHRGKGRTSAGFLLHEISQRMRRLVNGNKAPHFLLYSAHDSTLLALLARLGIQNAPAPNFAASIVFEVHAPAGMDLPCTCKVFYNARPDTEPLFQKSLKLPLTEKFVSYRDIEQGSVPFLDFYSAATLGHLSHAEATLVDLLQKMQGKKDRKSRIRASFMFAAREFVRRNTQTNVNLAVKNMHGLVLAQRERALAEGGDGKEDGGGGDDDDDSGGGTRGWIVAMWVTDAVEGNAAGVTKTAESAAKSSLQVNTASGRAVARADVFRGADTKSIVGLALMCRGRAAWRAWQGTEHHEAWDAAARKLDKGAGKAVLGRMSLDSNKSTFDEDRKLKMQEEGKFVLFTPIFPNTNELEYEWEHETAHEQRQADIKAVVDSKAAKDDEGKDGGDDDGSLVFRDVVNVPELDDDGTCTLQLDMPVTRGSGAVSEEKKPQSPRAWGQEEKDGAGDDRQPPRKDESASSNNDEGEAGDVAGDALGELRRTGGRKNKRPRRRTSFLCGDDVPEPNRADSGSDSEGDDGAAVVEGKNFPVVITSVVVKENLIDWYIDATVKFCRCAVVEAEVIRCELYQQQDAPQRFRLIQVFSNVNCMRTLRSFAYYQGWSVTVEGMLEETKMLHMVTQWPSTSHWRSTCTVIPANIARESVLPGWGRAGKGQAGTPFEKGHVGIFGRIHNAHISSSVKTLEIMSQLSGGGAGGEEVGDGSAPTDIFAYKNDEEAATAFQAAGMPGFETPPIESPMNLGIRGPGGTELSLPSRKVAPPALKVNVVHRAEEPS